VVRLANEYTMKFQLGINYWPISSAMYWWQRFDHDEVEHDFERIRRAGFDSIRIFLLWEDFQPAPNQVASSALANLVTVADIAAHNNLALIPTLFTGHMSGVNWIPAWALEPVNSIVPQRFRVVSGGKVVHAALKNWYTDEQVLTAQSYLAQQVALALHQHPALWAYDLGNENSNCVIPPSRASAIRWLTAITAAIRAVDVATPITIGLHMEDLEEDRRLGPAEAALTCDFLCMHGYPMYATWAKNASDELLLPFLGLITHWLSGKEVLFAEFGAPTLPGQDQRQLPMPPTILLEETLAAAFTERALERLVNAGFLGAMLWCYGDYAKPLWGVPPLDQAKHERHFGLWREDYTPKPALQSVKQFSHTARGDVRDDRFAWIDIPHSDFYTQPRDNLHALYQKFLRIGN
jgi:endo-1,4-beta-mannosidase